jgi:hypothetical protein
MFGMTNQAVFQNHGLATTQILAYVSSSESLFVSPSMSVPELSAEINSLFSFLFMSLAHRIGLKKNSFIALKHSHKPLIAFFR